MSAISERRLVQVVIDIQEQMELGSLFVKPGGFSAGMLLFAADDSAEIPLDAELVECNYDPSLRSFVLTLAHPSFEPCPVGARLKRLGDRFALRTLAVDRDSDGLWRDAGSSRPMSYNEREALADRQIAYWTAFKQKLLTPA